MSLSRGVTSSMLDGFLNDTLNKVRSLENYIGEANLPINSETIAKQREAAIPVVSPGQLAKYELDPELGVGFTTHTSKDGSTRMMFTDPVENFTLKPRQVLNLPEVGQFTITSPFGLRDVGRGLEHGQAIDVVATDLNIRAFKDGKIVRVNNGAPAGLTDPATTASLGNSIEVLHNDGTLAIYGHADPMTNEQVESLLNKQVKRGDVLGSYKKGTGSGTNLHTKIYLTVAGALRFKALLDPSAFILKGNEAKYGFIPTLGKNGKIVNAVKNSNVAITKKGLGGILYRK